MTAQRPALLLALAAALAAAGCRGSETAPAPSNQAASAPASSTPADPDAALDPAAMPVRIGQLGPSFPACYAVAQLRETVVEGDETVPVRSAPFEGAREVARIGAAGDFFICGSSHDQRWFAIVWDESGAAAAAAPSCGVSRPSSRRVYDGPCRSGWIASAPVRFESGMRNARTDRAEPGSNPSAIPSNAQVQRPAD